jgi:hypothetical protein
MPDWIPQLDNNIKKVQQEIAKLEADQEKSNELLKEKQALVDQKLKVTRSTVIILVSLLLTVFLGTCGPSREAESARRADQEGGSGQDGAGGEDPGCSAAALAAARRAGKDPTAGKGERE